MTINPRRRSATIGTPRTGAARRFMLPAVLAASLSLAACGSSTDATPANNTVPTVSSTSESVSAPESTQSTDASSDTSTESTESTDTSTETSTGSTDTSTETSTGSTDSSTETSTESTDTSTQTSTGSTDTSTESTGTSTEKTTSTAPTTGPLTVGKDGALTKPGTKLAFGKSAIVEFQTGKKGDKYYDHGTLQLTITKIVKGDPKIFDKLDNKADFKDMIPYYVFSQDTIVSFQGKASGNPPIPAIIDGVTKDGQLSGKAISFTGGPAACEDVPFSGIEVGLKATKCTIALAKKGGAPVIGAAFSGDDDIYPDLEKDPYYKSPILWLS